MFTANVHGIGRDSSSSPTAATGGCTMRHSFPLLGVLVCLAGTLRGEDVILENASCRMVFASEPTAHLASLVHRGRGTTVVANPTARSLFQLVLRGDDGKTRTIGSASAATSELVLAEPGVVRLAFGSFPDSALAVEVEAKAVADDPLGVWSIRLRNPQRESIETVRFPLLLAVPTLGEGGVDDVIVLPVLPGALVVNPGENWQLNAGVQTQYPGDMSAQFLAYQDREAGLFLGSRDAGSHPRALSVWKREDGFDFSHEYRLDGLSAEAWASPYPVTVGATQGRWYDSADLYKSWSREQTWCAKPLAQRDDIPDWWKRGPLIHTCAVRTFGKDRVESGSYYPKMLEHLRHLHGKVDGPIVAMLASWEKHRRWSGGDYFPVFDHDRAQTVIAEMKGEGFRPFFFLSGLYYAFENVGVNGGPVPAAAEHMDSYVIDETGKPAVYTLNESRKPVEWKRLSYEVCPGSDYARAFCHGIVDDAHALGVDMLQMDQTVRGAGHACYAKNHHHPVGDGPHVATQFQALLADMRAYGKAKTPDFVLLHEEPHEELIPCLDGFHMREYKEKWWYRSKPGVIGIPLFSYLYHEYAIGYGGDNALIGPRGEAWNTRCHAVNLVTGKTPGISVWSNPSQLFESHPAPLAMARNHCQILKTRAALPLMQGTMLHPYELAVPSQTYHVWTTTGGKGHAEDFVEPAVLTSSWLAPDGSIGHLFVNPTMVAQPLNVAIDTRNRPMAGRYDVSLYTSESTTFSPLWEDTELPRPFAGELPPLGVLYLELRSRP
jgi:hypothetical protein